MALAIRSVLADGLYRTFARNGLILIGGTFLANVVFQVGFTSLIFEEFLAIWEEFLQEYPEFGDAVTDPSEIFPLAVAMPDGLALALLVIGVVLGVVVLAVAVRIFYSDETERIPTSYVTDDIAWVTVNLFVGSLIFGLLWLLGLVLLVVPGIIVFVLLVYYIAGVAVEGRSFIDAMARSWSVTRGNRIRVFLLFFAYFVILMLAGIAFGMVTTFVAVVNPLLGELVSLATNSIVIVYFAAVVAISFRRLVEPTPTEEEDDAFDEFIPADQHTQW